MKNRVLHNLSNCYLNQDYEHCSMLERRFIPQVVGLTAGIIATFEARKWLHHQLIPIF